VLLRFLLEMLHRLLLPLSALLLAALPPLSRGGLLTGLFSEGGTSTAAARLREAAGDYGVDVSTQIHGRLSKDTFQVSSCVVSCRVVSCRVVVLWRGLICAVCVLYVLCVLFVFRMLHLLRGCLF
jgi:hypothetical protein